jgi:RNA polymerase sigma-70 factor (ECF subfamily)
MSRGKDSDAPLEAEVDTRPWDFSAHFEGVFRKLWLIAVGVVRDSALADDIVQEAAMIGYRKRDQFQPGTNFGAWMGQIVRHTALNQGRKKRGRREASLVGVAESQAGPQPGAGDDTLAISKSGALPADQTWFDDAVVGALQEVSDTARSCLLLRTVEGLSYGEIAAMLDIPEGTAMSHVHRARAALREKLAAHDSRGFAGGRRA